MKNIAIIPARGGSKRIPRKNIKNFLGKPIIAYSIEAALASNLFDEIMVSTDDQEIASIAITYGAKVPFYRSAENSDDYASTEDVLQEVIEQYQKQDEFFAWICCIYPTAPLIEVDKLQQSMELCQEKQADALIPVIKFSYPPQRSFVLQDNQYLDFKWQECKEMRSQDLEPFYHDAGQFYWIKNDIFLQTHTLVPARTIPYVLSEIEVQDIDHLDDWEMAEIKYRLLQRKKEEKR